MRLAKIFIKNPADTACIHCTCAVNIYAPNIL